MSNQNEGPWLSLFLSEFTIRRVGAAQPVMSCNLKSGILLAKDSVTFKYFTLFGNGLFEEDKT